MHPHFPQITIGRAVLKKCDDLDILGVTGQVIFSQKMTFEKHLCSVSKAVYQRFLS